MGSSFFAGIPKPAHNLGQPYALYNGADYMYDYSAKPYAKRNQKQGKDDDAEHHFRLSVELKSVRIDLIDTLPAVFLRYSHPLFASSPPIATTPPATINARVESILPNSFTLFEFPMKVKNLLTSIESTPLPVEVVDISKGEEEIVGVAAVYLVEVMKTRPTGTEAGGVLFVWENYVPIHAYIPDSDEQRLIGFVRVMLTLEDRGVVERATAEDHLHEHAKQEGFAAALELDLWLRAEQEKYTEELKEEETRMLQQIASEWKMKEQIREEEFKRTEFEYSKLKSKLEDDDREISQREKKVDLFEFELTKRMESLKLEFDRKFADANETMERMKDDFAHKAEAERRKREAMGATHKLLADEISVSEKKLKQTEEALLDFRKRMENSPSALLQLEIASLAAEKIDMQRKVDQSANICKATRQKLLKAYQELTRLKNQALAAQQARIRREHEELESLRLHAIAQQHTKLLHGDKEEIMDFKKELRKLKNKELNEGMTSEEDTGDEGEDEGDLEVEELEEPERKGNENISLKPATTSQNGVHDVYDDSSDTEKRLRQEVARLTQERDTLLSTGLYSNEDRVITIIQKALDLQTQRLRDELLKKVQSKAQPAPPAEVATSKPQKPSGNTISKKPAKSKVKSAPKPKI